MGSTCDSIGGSLRVVLDVLSRMCGRVVGVCGLV